ncbi:MAG: nucleotidyltransferase [Spiribacter salinus]|uniref:Nucleotidyltransferase n=1 Tax=Spiribacter salinus TaxID=1335746 RepID=A0A540VPC4_9GAMM|nr:MAG: nucleotidyltransferase [Spiribacter salinus]
MKNLRVFKKFLTDTVNLNPTRLESLEKTSTSLSSFVENSDWEPSNLEWYPQGSWAHETIIKPLPNKGFDADVLAIVDPVDGWTASDYINNLYSAFRDSDIYRDKAHRYSHCVTLDYAAEKRIDIAPCIRNRWGFERLEVCNRDTDEFEESQPKYFTEWLKEKNTLSGNNSFRKVTRLVKYLRDIKTTFTCSSVCLTTLLAHQIQANDKGSADFADTPSALRTMFERLDTWLQIRPVKPQVSSPFSNEDFSVCWTDDQYSNFRDKVSKYRVWIDDAFQETDRNKSISKWRRVFGDDFGKNEGEQQAKSVTAKAVDHLRENVRAVPATELGFVGDVVDLVKQYGSRAIPSTLSNLPYLSQPTWRSVGNQLFSVHLIATLHRSRGGATVCTVSSGDVVPKKLELKFTARLATGMPLNTQDYRVEWRVTNTGEEALAKGQLRGSFIGSNSGGDRWESLEYRGVHFVEAFVIRKRDGIQVSRSDPFYVVIE